MLFNGVTGALISITGEDLPPASATRGAMYGLHLGHFAHPLLRALFFLCGLAGCAMVATGALLWAVKERQKYAKVLAKGGHVGFGLRLVDGLNIAAIAGLPIAFAAYFWANRLLPVLVEKRAEGEISWFFMAWAIAAILAHVSPTRRMWQLQLWLGAALLSGVPLINGLTTTSHLGVALSQGKGLGAVAGFDLTVLALGLMLGYAAWSLGRNRKRISKPVQQSAGHQRADMNMRELT
jgi:hypothetical protein